MSILLNEDFTFIVQGITGREAVNLTRECLDYGSKIVGGVTPGRKGREVHGVPVFDTVEQAVEHHGSADRRLGRHRPPRLHQGRRLRGDRERIELIVVVTERIPRRDVAEMVELAAVHFAALAAGRHAPDDLRAEIEALAGQVDRLAAGDALDDEGEVLLQQDAHPCTFSTARPAASHIETERSQYSIPYLSRIL